MSVFSKMIRGARLNLPINLDRAWSNYFKQVQHTLALVFYYQVLGRVLMGLAKLSLNMPIILQ